MVWGGEPARTVPLIIPDQMAVEPVVALQPEAETFVKGTRGPMERRGREADAAPAARGARLDHANDARADAGAAGASVDLELGDPPFLVSEVDDQTSHRIAEALDEKIEMLWIDGLLPQAHNLILLIVQIVDEITILIDHGQPRPRFDEKTHQEVSIARLRETKTQTVRTSEDGFVTTHFAPPRLLTE